MIAEQQNIRVHGGKYRASETTFLPQRLHPHPVYIRQKTSFIPAFPRRPGHSTGNGWYKVFELKKLSTWLIATRVLWGKHPKDHASNMRHLEYQFHTTVEKVWVALLSFVLLSY